MNSAKLSRSPYRTILIFNQDNANIHDICPGRAYFNKVVQLIKKSIGIIIC